MKQKLIALLVKISKSDIWKQTKCWIIGRFAGPRPTPTAEILKWPDHSGEIMCCGVQSAGRLAAEQRL
jgi:hypothetical protein